MPCPEPPAGSQLVRSVCTRAHPRTRPSSCTELGNARGLPRSVRKPPGSAVQTPCAAKSTADRLAGDLRRPSGTNCARPRQKCPLRFARARWFMDWRPSAREWRPPAGVGVITLAHCSRRTGCARDRVRTSPVSDRAPMTSIPSEAQLYRWATWQSGSRVRLGERLSFRVLINCACS